MASWKKIITNADDSDYKNSNVSATDIDANVSDAEFGHLNGVTSAIQAQIDSAASSGGLSNEEVQDIVGGMLSGNTETGITVTYDDDNNEIDFVVASQTDNNFTTTLKNKLDGIEASADVTDTTNVVSALTAGTNIAIANDGTISSSDTNTTYTAGTGISLSGTQFNIGQDVATTASPTFAQLTVDSLTFNNGVIQASSGVALDLQAGGVGTGASIRLQDDVYIAGDLTVQGDTVTINTGTLQVEDKLVKLANVSTPTTTTADGAGIQIEASSTEAEWPELKWDNAGELTGWTLSDYKSTLTEDIPVAVMQFGTDAPSGTPNGGDGMLFADKDNGNLYIYI